MSHQPFHPSELNGADESADTGLSAATAAEAFAMARELEALDTGAIRPSDAFTDRVFAAIANEPLPQPMAVAGLAAREGRLGVMLGALRDTWRVAFSGSRPIGTRAPAMAFVLIVILALGSAGSLAAVGAYNALVPPDRGTPPVLATPSGPVATPSLGVEPTETPEATESVEPSETAEPSETPEATETPEPTETPEGTKNPGSTERPRATETPEPTETPEVETPEPGDASATETPKPGETPKPSDGHGGGG